MKLKLPTDIVSTIVAFLITEAVLLLLVAPAVVFHIWAKAMGRAKHERHHHMNEILTEVWNSYTTSPIFWILLLGSTSLFAIWLMGGMRHRLYAGSGQLDEIKQNSRSFIDPTE